MKQCKVARCESTELIYSGVDAFMLGGFATETFCYSCGNAYATIMKSMVEQMKDTVSA